MFQEKAFSLVAQERLKQTQKWGIQDHELPVWVSILTEEVGEFSEAVLHSIFGGKESENVKAEIIQVAAVAIQIIEHLERLEASKHRPTQPVGRAVDNDGDYPL